MGTEIVALAVILFGEHDTEFSILIQLLCTKATENQSYMNIILGCETCPWKTTGNHAEWAKVMAHKILRLPGLAQYVL